MDTEDDTFRILKRTDYNTMSDIILNTWMHTDERNEWFVQHGWTRAEYCNYNRKIIEND